MAEKSQNFMATLPGILTGIAAVITALSGLFLAINKIKATPPPEKPPIRDTQNPTPVKDVVQVKDREESIEPESVSKITDKEHLPEPIQAEPPPKIVIQKNPLVDTATAQAAISQPKVHEPFPEIGPLVDCTLFPTVNTVGSLMSWSNYYQKELIAAEGLKRRATEPCNRTLDYRGMAHCKEPGDAEIRQALLESLTLCRAADIEWTDISHSTITGKN